MNVVELFSGAGGAARGLEAAGFEHIGMVEWDADACRTVDVSMPEAPVLCGSVDDPDIMASVIGEMVNGFEVSHPDLLWSSFPCQSFSQAGKRAGASDDRNKWPATVAWIDALNPTWFLAENVPGLTFHRGKANCGRGAVPRPLSCPACYFNHVILKQLRQRFAHVGWYTLNAADFGVAQTRKRVFIWAGPEPLKPPKPTHAKGGVGGLKPWVSMGAALGLDITDSEQRAGCRNVSGQPSRTIETKGNTMVRVRRIVGGGTNPRPGDDRTYRRLDHGPSVTIAARRVSNAGPWLLDIQADGQYVNRGRVAFNEGPVLASDAQWLEAAEVGAQSTLTERRRLTVAEVAVLQGFPIIQWQGSQTSQYRQVGNAVPPRLAEVVARTIPTK